MSFLTRNLRSRAGASAVLIRLLLVLLFLLIEGGGRWSLDRRLARAGPA